jgi:signal transduction histidine kinase
VKVEKEDVECEEIFSSVESNLLYKTEHNQATVVVADNFPKTIVGNKILLIQLFQNLIQNAIKYRRDEISPVVQVSFESGEVFETVRIIDNGMGISPDKINGLTEAFVQSEFNSIEKGIGLGLSISRSIMKIHGGEIKISSEYGKGTTICLIFPKGMFT